MPLPYQPPLEQSGGGCYSYTMARRSRILPVIPSADGFVLAYNTGDAKRNVDVVYEMIGGNERFADWADKNPGEFYTKMYAKNIKQERDLNLTTAESLEDKLKRIHGEVIETVPLSVDGVPTTIGGGQVPPPPARPASRFAQVYGAQQREREAAERGNDLDAQGVEDEE